MNGKPVVVLCNHACIAEGALDIQRLSAAVAKSDVIGRLVVLDWACHATPEVLTEIRRTKVVFAGCPLLRRSGFYDEAARRLVIGKTDWIAIDLKADILDLYEEKDGIEENVRAVLESAGEILARTQPVTNAVVVANRKVLLYGSGVSGLTAAIGLAAEGIPVDLLETNEYPISPGCFAETLREPGFEEALRQRALKSERVTFLPPASVRNPTPIDGGFVFMTAKGDIREYGSIVFAPERQEVPSEDTGAFTLTQLFAHMRSGKAIAGQVVFLLDRESETEPEVFRDVLRAALHLQEKMYAKVLVLARNARVSLPGMQELYDECREAGIVFLRYRAVSVTSEYGDFTLRGTDDHTNAGFLIQKPKILVVPGRIALDESAREFARALNLRLIKDFYTQPDSLWRLPNETNRAGVFAVGSARGNMAADGIRTDITCLAYSLRERLSPEGMQIEEHIPAVNKDRCAYCLTCVRVCPFGAMAKDPVERVATVYASACKACGLCAAECPAQAIDLRNLSSTQVRAGIAALAR